MYIQQISTNHGALFHFSNLIRIHLVVQTLSSPAGPLEALADGGAAWKQKHETYDKKRLQQDYTVYTY